VIVVVLEDSPDDAGKNGDPQRSYDEAPIGTVSRDYAAKLFPGEVMQIG